MHCNLCGSSEYIVLWKIREYTIHKCRQCDLVYADVRAEHLIDLYEKDYYENVYYDYYADKKIHEINAKMMLNKIEGIFPKGKLLEIGSAFGFFLKSARNRGWETTGIECSKYASDIAKKEHRLHVMTTDFLHANLEEMFDVICLFDTLEHVLDANTALQKIATILHPGGGIIISTGDIDSVQARLLRKHWRFIAPPFHVYYYSLHTLSLLLQKHGFSILSVEYMGKYFNVGSVLQYLFNNVALKFLKRKLPVIPVKINPLDIMFVMARLQD